MTWFKLFCEFASDPRVQSLSESMQRRLIMLWCLRCHGDLAKLTDREIALALRIPLWQLKKTHALFTQKGFIRDDWTMPKWDARQAPTDPGAAQRMRDYRKRKAERSDGVTRNGDLNVRPRAREIPEQKEIRTEESRSEGGARPPERSPSPNGPTDPTGPDPPDRSALPAPPEVMEAARKATDLAGPEWGAWVVRMWRQDYPVHWSIDALAKLHARGQLRFHLGEGILRSYREQGGPDHRPGDPPPPVEPRRLEPPPFIPPGPEGDAIRKMYGLEEGGGDR